MRVMVNGPCPLTEPFLMDRVNYSSVYGFIDLFDFSNVFDNFNNYLIFKLKDLSLNTFDKRKKHKS